MPNVLSPRYLVSRPDNMDETVLSSSTSVDQCHVIINDITLGSHVYSFADNNKIRN